MAVHTRRPNQEPSGTSQSGTPTPVIPLTAGPTAGQDPARLPISSSSCGTTWKRSPTTVPAGAFPLDQLMLGHLSPDRRQVKDLPPVHPADRPSRQGCPAPAAAARLMPYLPVRPGYLRRRLPLMPVLPARPAPALLPQRPRRRLGKSLARWRLGGVPRRLPQPGLKLRDPLPCPLQFRPRLRRLTAQRHHQRREHLG